MGGSGKDWGRQTVHSLETSQGTPGLNVLPSDLGKLGHKWVPVSWVSVLWYNHQERRERFLEPAIFHEFPELHCVEEKVEAWRIADLLGSAEQTRPPCFMPMLT